MSIGKKIIPWFEKHKRTLPFRKSPPNPYEVWISEMMLQQTQVDTVVDYFNRFIALFPDIQTLANATQQDVLKMWEGLGYYARARNLHQAAKMMLDKFQGELPKDYETLQTLPGIGPYAAAAIASIAFNKEIPVVDGNVLRVFTRYWGISKDIRLTKVRDELFEKLRPEIKGHTPSSFNQGVMELGALICKPKKPLCGQCPLSENCLAFLNQLTHEIPYKSKKAPIPHYHIGVGIIRKKSKILIGKRKDTGMLGGLWEFPGGKKKDEEPIEETVKREIYEETTLKVQVEEKIAEINHAYTHFKITLHGFYCQILSGKEKPLSAVTLSWVTPDQLNQYPFPKATSRLIQHLK